ncbi:hypothetical protein EVJ58_g1068 [Rhodofomes roseus]|uniref:Protein kinase domain-containing protein n=1 Tax=Rhodofomes roseus TaxID=34475 RepID=A0A4Y9Z383_9APHY|nr:hypothetical protein EVJ58_g1068 [Rhodofomes roseus]
MADGDAQHVHHMWTQPTVDLNSPELTIFYRVLTAAYNPDSLEGAPPPQAHLLRPAPVPGLKRSSALVDWQRKNRPVVDDEDDSSDEENVRITRRRVKGKRKMRNGEVSTNILETQLYVPFGDWAFAAQKPMVDVKTILNLGVSGTCSATLRDCVIADRPLSVLSHSWPLKKNHQWSGFYRELALLKSSDHLRSLQGNVVPALINVTRSVDGVSLNMAPPHPTFWMDASADMPFILKACVVEAYDALHRRGILHGNPQLQNMLICGDGTVKLVDFQSSRSMRSISVVGIYDANSADLELEARQVRFKIDYADARKYELDKRERARAIALRNQERAKLRRMALARRWDGPVEEDEVYTGDDLDNPPIPEPFWTDHWVNDIDRTPRRFIVPGKTQEEVDEAVRNFQSVLVETQANYDRWWFTNKHHAGSSQSKSPPQEPEDDALEVILLGGVYVRRRRRTPTESGEVGGPTLTRLDTQEEIRQFVREAEADAALATEYPFPSRVIAKTCDGRAVGADDYGYDLPPASSSASGKPKGPIVRDYGAVVAPLEPLPSNPYEKTTSSVIACGAGGDLPRASSTTSQPPKDVKVVDYAFKPHAARGGYYVCHPPTENRIGVERVRYIRETNRKTAHDLGFEHLYSTDDKYCLPPSFARPGTDRHPFTTISLGTLKRRREKIIGREEYDDYPHVPLRKRLKTKSNEESGEDPDQDSDKDSDEKPDEKRPPHDEIESCEYLNVKADCQLIEPSEYARRHTAVVKARKWEVLEPAPHGSEPERLRFRAPRVLKAARVRRFRKLPATRKDWTGEREPCLSPKLGPPKLPVSRDETRAILGSFVFDALPHLHVRRLTAEHRKLSAKKAKGNKEGVPPPREASGVEVLPSSPGAEASTSASADEVSEDNVDEQYFPVDDSAPVAGPSVAPVQEPPVADDRATDVPQARAPRGHSRLTESSRWKLSGPPPALIAVR